MSENNTDSSPEMLAAIDLGSNSFHMTIVRVKDGDIRVQDRIREMVRLGDGLNEANILDETVQKRALECLDRFGQRLTNIPANNIRAVGTNTLRKARNSRQFLREAEKLVGRPIEIISGIEEARLIYLGVSHSLPENELRHLVVDIGGGSTEIIIGEKFEPILMESLYMGCVNISKKFFLNGLITKKRLKKAKIHTLLELEGIAHDYIVKGWDQAVGSSGTIRAIAKVAKLEGWAQDNITLESLEIMQQALLEAGHVNNIKLNGLSEERRPVFIGGYIVLHAIFDALKIKEMTVSDGALREGLIYESLGRINQEDVRIRTISNIATRYRVDTNHAKSVEQTALELYKAVSSQWDIGMSKYSDLLIWASQLHEIGLAIANTGYHKHAAYLVENSNMPGFTIHEQVFLAAMIRCHRRKISRSFFKALPDALVIPAIRLCALLRLAVKFQRNRADEPIPVPVITAGPEMLKMELPLAWASQHSLTIADLESEKAYLRRVGIKLELVIN